MYLYVGITKNKVFILPGKTEGLASGLDLIYMACFEDVQNISVKMVWIAHCSCYVLSASAKYIAKTNIFCILLLLASRWVQDGFNIGFGCCMTGAKYIAKNGMDLILLLMASRWVQDGFNIGFGCCMLASRQVQNTSQKLVWI